VRELAERGRYRADVDPGSRGASDSTRAGATPAPAMIVALVLVRVVILVVTIHVGDTRTIVDGDVLRFGEIATTPGTPYRDFPVEYAPIETISIRAVAGDGIPATVTRLAWIWFVCELATAGLLAWGWDRRVAVAYLVIGLPLLTQMSLRLDPLSIVLAVAAFALVRRGREGAGGVALGLAVLTKVWPIFLLPVLLIQRRARALTSCVATLAVGGAAWLAVGGLDAPVQVLSYRHATGWHIQSAVGVVVWIATGGPARGQVGAIRVGVMTPLERALLGAATVAVLVAVWTLAHRRRAAVDPSGRPSLAAVAGTIVLSPVFSSHYVGWLVPWGAVAWGEREGRTPARLLFATCLLTAVLGATYDAANWDATGPHIPVIKALLVVINGALAAQVVLWLRRPTSDPDGERPLQFHGRPAEGQVVRPLVEEGEPE